MDHEWKGLGIVVTVTGQDYGNEGDVWLYGTDR